MDREGLWQEVVPPALSFTNVNKDARWKRGTPREVAHSVDVYIIFDTVDVFVRLRNPPDAFPLRGVSITEGGDLAFLLRNISLGLIRQFLS